jgi:hypothetical protein
MNWLIGCEFSGKLRNALRKRGVNAWSCDLIPSLDNSPFHIIGDIRDVLKRGWDRMIVFPPCDRLLVAGALHWEKWQQSGEQRRGIEFFLEMANTHVEKVAIENPVGIMSTVYREPDQYIQPWMFGHMETKKTCLWLRKFPKLVPTNNVFEAMMQLPKAARERVHYESPGIKNGLTRSQRRAILFDGFADAMAEQWGRL